MKERDLFNQNWVRKKKKAAVSWLRDAGQMLLPREVVGERNTKTKEKVDTITILANLEQEKRGREIGELLKTNHHP